MGTKHGNIPSSIQSPQQLPPNPEVTSTLHLVSLSKPSKCKKKSVHERPRSKNYKNNVHFQHKGFWCCLTVGWLGFSSLFLQTFLFYMSDTALKSTFYTNYYLLFYINNVNSSSITISTCSSKIFRKHKESHSGNSFAVTLCWQEPFNVTQYYSILLHKFSLKPHLSSQALGAQCFEAPKGHRVLGHD